MAAVNVMVLSRVSAPCGFVVRSRRFGETCPHFQGWSDVGIDLRNHTSI